MSIQLSSIMVMFFVHKGGQLENRQFLAKMHQIAPNCISNSKIFPGVTPPDPIPGVGDAPPQTPPSLGSFAPRHAPAPPLGTDSVQTGSVNRVPAFTGWG